MSQLRRLLDLSVELSRGKVIFKRDFFRLLCFLPPGLVFHFLSSLHGHLSFVFIWPTLSIYLASQSIFCHSMLKILFNYVCILYIRYSHVSLILSFIFFRWDDRFNVTITLFVGSRIVERESDFQT
uniref:Uncharacterized protein n=1 Tax=Cacopsylla melanoneura TaxID=428564 RepID=A0A8D9BVR2_9HEMI